MKHLDSAILLIAGMLLLLLGALYTAINPLGQIALLGTGTCLLFMGAVRLTNIATFERVMANTLKFLASLFRFPSA